jgi:hypothetical protein
MTAEDQRDETSGVVLQLGCGVPSTAALEAAMLLARTLSGAIEGQFITDTTLVDAASYAFTREITYFGGRTRAIEPQRVLEEMQASAQATRRRLVDIARLYQVELHYRVVERQRATPAPPLGRGTRFLALSQPQTAAAGRRLTETIRAFPDVEGFLIAGAGARRRRGPILLVVRTARELAALHATIGALARANDRGVLILPTDPDPLQVREIIDAARHYALPDARLLPPVAARCAAIESIVARSDASLVALALDHPLATSDVAQSHLAATLSTPLLLLRQMPAG